MRKKRLVLLVQSSYTKFGFNIPPTQAGVPVSRKGIILPLCKIKYARVKQKEILPPEVGAVAIGLIGPITMNNKFYRLYAQASFCYNISILRG